MRLAASRSSLRPITWQIEMRLSLGFEPRVRDLTMEDSKLVGRNENGQLIADQEDAMRRTMSK